MNAALLENSPRLQKLLDALLDFGEHTTRDLIRLTGGCAINSTKAELCDAKNGVPVHCRYLDETRDGNSEFVYWIVKEEYLQWKATRGQGGGRGETTVRQTPNTVMPTSAAREPLRQATCACPGCGSWHRRGRFCNDPKCSRDCSDDAPEASHERKLLTVT
jgi:hypothetical protein